MDEWEPIHMVYGMPWKELPLVRLGAAAMAFVHKLQKGHFFCTSQGAVKEDLKSTSSKNWYLAVLEANGGVWDGVKSLSHALFLWASGSELTKMLEGEDHISIKYIYSKILGNNCKKKSLV